MYHSEKTHIISNIVSTCFYLRVNYNNFQELIKKSVYYVNKSGVLSGA